MTLPPVARRDAFHWRPPAHSDAGRRRHDLPGRGVRAPDNPLTERAPAPRGGARVRFAAGRGATRTGHSAQANKILIRLAYFIRGPAYKIE